MKKRLATLLLASVGLATAGSAEVLVDYQFNDVDGTLFENAAYTGTQVGGDRDGNDEWIVTNGALRIVKTAGIAKPEGTLASSYTSGIVTTKVTVASYDLSGGTQNNMDSTFGVRNVADKDNVAVGFRFTTDGTGEVAARSGAPGSSGNSGDLGTSSSTPLYLLTVLDLDTGVATGSYMFEGDADWTLIKSGTSSFTNGFDTLSWIVESHQYGDDDYINIDSVTTTYTAIPEPATLGMIGMIGVGILFIRRRRFMI